MDTKNTSLDYLVKISDIDKEIINNTREKSNLINHSQNRIMVYKFINKMASKKVLSLIIIMLSILLFYIIKDIFISIIATLGSLVLYNSIICILVRMLRPKKDYYQSISNYDLENERLLSKRNTYINLYKYTIDGDNTIIENIKLKIQKKKFYEYNKYIDTNWLHQDEKAFNTLIEMYNKELSIMQSIKNKIFFELNFEPRTEQLSKEELQLIANSL